MPNRFMPIHSSSTPTDVVKQVNNNFAQLDAEAVTKTFNGSQGNYSLIQGRLPNGRYGILLYDDTGVPVVLIGQAPDDGRMGIWQAKPGNNVLTQLGG